MTTEEILKLTDTYQYKIATGDRFDVGKGVGAFKGVQTLLNLGLLGSPIDLSTIKPTGPDSPTTVSKVAACTNVYKVDEVVKVAASVSGSYGGASGSMAASYAKSLSITETSSSYIAFFRKSYGRVYINSDAKLSKDAVALLKSNAKEFILRYGKYYVSAYQLSKMFFGEVRIDAASMADKVKMDAAVSASYNSILKVNGSFESDLQKSQAKYQMSVTANSMGTNVPHTGISSLKELAEAVKKIEEESDANIAINSDVTISSWLHLKDVVDNINGKDIELFKPELSPDQLDTYDACYERLQWMKDFTQDCITNLDAKLVRQWKVTDKADREQKLTEARDFAGKWLHKLSNITESEVAAPGFIGKLDTEIINTQDGKITPALKIRPFTFYISLNVASDYDNYNPVAWYTMTVKVDPNQQISVIDNAIDVDNYHSNCRHFHGHQHAKYTDGSQGKNGLVVKPKIEFNTWWDRTCGSTGWSNTATFTEDTTGECQLDYNDTVRVKLKYNVVFGQLKMLPSGLDNGVMEEAYVFTSDAAI